VTAKLTVYRESTNRRQQNPPPNRRQLGFFLDFGVGMGDFLAKQANNGYR
jgi:hypothetical protein